MQSVLDRPMAKLKGRSDEPRRRKPGPEPTGRKSVAVAVKGSDEWRAWLEQGAKFCLLDVSKLVDIAVTDYLKARGFPQERPER